MAKSIMPINDLSTCAGNNIYTGIMTKNIAIDIAIGMCILEVQNIESMKEIPSTNLLAMRHFLYDKLVGIKTNRIS